MAKATLVRPNICSRVINKNIHNTALKRVVIIFCKPSGHFVHFRATLINLAIILIIIKPTTIATIVIGIFGTMSLAETDIPLKPFNKSF
jgi:uncharacterized membrane protein YesL